MKTGSKRPNITDKDLPLTDALQKHVVIVVATGAVAGVARDVVDTYTALTHLRVEQFTLIHICESR
jgi:hypothetical protein